MNFRDRIKEICADRGMTQKDLAKNLGITAISLNKTLRGGYPQLQTLEKIAGVLNIPITDLFEKPSGGSTITCPHCGKPIKVEKSEAE